MEFLQFRVEKPQIQVDNQKQYKLCNEKGKINHRAHRHHKEGIRNLPYGKRSKMKKLDFEKSINSKSAAIFY